MLPILFVTVFIDLVGFGIIIPFLAYYVESFGARAATVGPRRRGPPADPIALT